MNNTCNRHNGGSVTSVTSVTGQGQLFDIKSEPKRAKRRSKSAHFRAKVRAILEIYRPLEVTLDWAAKAESADGRNKKK